MRILFGLMTYLMLTAWSGASLAQTSADTVSIRETIEAVPEGEADETLYEEETDELSGDEEVEEEAEEVPEALRSITDEDWQKVLADSQFRYTRAKEEVIKPSKQPVVNHAFEWLNSGLLKALLYLLVIAAVLFALYSFLSQSNLSWWQRKTARASGNETTGSEPDPNDYEQPDDLLKKALLAGDYRLAVRIHYLHLLHRLQDRGCLVQRAEKTNWDYVVELKGQPFAAAFQELTRYFDYIWYGEFSIDETAYRLLREKFEHIQKQVQGI